MTTTSTFEKNITEKTTVAPKPPGQPYALHDAYITGFKIEKDNLYLLFDQGFYSLPDADGNDHLIKGQVVIKGVDWDFAVFNIVKFQGDTNRGKYKGKRYPLKKFCRKHPHVELEIVDSYFGGYTLYLSGFLHGEKKITEWALEVYHTGDVEYKEV